MNVEAIIRKLAGMPIPGYLLESFEVREVV